MEIMALVCKFGPNLPGNQREKETPLIAILQYKSAWGKTIIPQGKEFNALAFEIKKLFGGMELVTETDTDKSCLVTVLWYLEQKVIGRAVLHLLCRKYLKYF